MIIAKIAGRSLHADAVQSNAEVEAIHDLAAFQEKLSQEARETRRRLASSLHQAKHKARKKGYEQGRNQALQEVNMVFASYVKMWRSAESRLPGVIEEAVREALGKLPEEELFLKRMQKCLQAARKTPVLRIHVHPLQFRLVDNMILRLDDGHSYSGCEVVADPNLQEGACVVETDTGVFDIDFNMQVRAMRDFIVSGLKANASVDEKRT